MGQYCVTHPLGKGANETLLVLCAKIEQEYLIESCAWLGIQFQASEVLLISTSLNSVAGPAKSIQEIQSRWIRTDCGEECLRAEKSQDQASVVSQLLVSAEPEDLHDGHLLIVPSRFDWSGEAYYLIRGCKTEVSSSDNGDDSNYLSIMLSKTAVELSRLGTGEKQNERRSQVEDHSNGLSLGNPLDVIESGSSTCSSEIVCASSRCEVDVPMLSNQRRYRLATVNAGISAWEWNLHTNTVTDDGNLSRILGYPHQDFTNLEDWVSKIHPDDLPNVRAKWADFSQGRTKLLFLEKRMRHSLGHWVWFSTQGSLFSDDPNSRTAIGTDLDITKHKIAVDRLAELQNEIIKNTRLSAVGEIAAGLAHDITQPITAICNYSSATRHLLTMPRSEEHQETVLSYLHKIEQASKVASNVLRGIHSYIQDAGGKRSVQSLGRIVDGILELDSFDMSKKNIEVQRFKEADSCLVNVDRSQLIHVLMNLINNAMDAVVAGETKRPQIIIKTAMKRGHGIISVEDNGCGISKEQALLIFAPFFSTKSGGTGMGLAICRTLIESNLGSITVEERPGDGAKFSILLPKIEGRREV